MNILLQIRIVFLFAIAHIAIVLALTVLATFVFPDAFDASVGPALFKKVGIFSNVIAFFMSLVVALSYRAQSVFSGSLSPLSFIAELTNSRTMLWQYLAIAAIGILLWWFNLASAHFHGASIQLPLKSKLMILGAYCWFAWRAISFKVAGKL